jgi:hypothetical protein
MDTINQRLEALVHALGFSSLNAFDKALQVPRNTTVCYVGEQKSKPGPEFLRKLFVTFPNVDARWVITGEGSSFTPEKLRKDYIETIEQRLEMSERTNRRYETMIDMAAQRRETNFQRLSKRTPEGRIIQFVAKNLAKIA